jgi:hypothetical protein
MADDDFGFPEIKLHDRGRDDGNPFEKEDAGAAQAPPARATPGYYPMPQDSETEPAGVVVTVEESGELTREDSECDADLEAGDTLQDTDHAD